VSERHRGSAEPAEVPLPPIGDAIRTAPPRASSGQQPTYTRRKAPEHSPWSLIGLGSLACFIGGVLLAIGNDVANFVGFALIGLGSIVISIGTIAEGVRMGARWVAFDRGE
jgi:hypothetical protein